MSPAATTALTLPSQQRDFTEWRKNRRHYAVWAVDADRPAVGAASEALARVLAPYLLADYRRQPHVTVQLCGFPGTTRQHADDYTPACLERQIAALTAARVAPFTVHLTAPASFTSAPYLAVHDPAGHLARLRQALGGPAQEAEHFVYVPHLTLGLYRDAFPLAEVLADMARAAPAQPLALTVSHLSLMTYEAAIIGGPLRTAGRFDLASNAYCDDTPLFGE